MIKDDPTNNEAPRLQCLKEYKILDSPSEQEFDDITKIVAEICQAPIALITLLDEQRVWFKSKYGVDINEIPREGAFCDETIKVGKDEAFIIYDTRKDPRYAKNPIVQGAPHIVFYAGVPLRSPEGYVVGTLCALDQQPRELSQAQENALTALARQVVHLLELRKNRLKVEENESKHRFLIDNSIDAIYLMDEYGNIKDVNQKACEMTGWTYVELCQFTIDQVDPNFSPEAFKAFWDEKVGVETMLFETHHKRKDGTLIPVEVNGIPFRIDNTPYFYGVARDLTERKKAENRLKESEERFKATFKQDKSIKLLINPATGDIVDANTAAAKFYGYSIQELTAMNIGQINTLSPEAVQEELAHARELEKNYFNFRHQLADGTIRDVEVYSTPVTYSGKKMLFSIVHDITDKLRALKNLQESEEKYRLLAENTSDGVALYENNMVKYASPGYSKMLGYSKEEIEQIGMNTILSRIHPDDVEQVSNRMQLAIDRKETHYRYDFRYKTKKGGYIWVEDSISNEYNESGRFLRSVINSRDVTDRKKAEQSLKESEERYRTLFNRVTEGFYRIDLSQPMDTNMPKEDQVQFILQNAFIAESNEAFKQMMQNDYQGRSLDDLQQSEKRLSHIHEIVKAFIDNNYQPIEHETMYHDANGKPQYFIRNVIGIFDNNRWLTRFWARLTDVTQIREYEAQLIEAKEKAEENEKLYRTIFDTSNDGIFIYESRDKLAFANKAACKLHNMSEEELLNSHPESFIHPNAHSVFLQFIEAADNGQEFLADAKGIQKNGKEFYVVVYGCPLYIGDKKYYFSTVRDISKQKEYEETLKERNEEIARQNEEYITTNEELIESNKRMQEMNERLKKANQELDSFVYRVSHDLRAPITSSLGLARIIQESDSLEEIHHMSSLQKESLVKLDVFIRDILDYSRNSRIEVKPEAISFDKMVEDCLAEGWPMHAEDIGVDVVKEIAQEMTFKTDKLRIKIILQNLISNALKFQNLYTENPFVHINIQVGQAQAAITIADNGIGIAPEFQERIFEMFYRATDKKPGSGIGLYIVKDCIDKLKGTIHLESDVGEGARFTLRIPNML